MSRDPKATTETWTGEEPLPERPGAVSAPAAPSGGARRYDPIAAIGKGAIGIVRSMYDNTLERTVAYKSLKDSKNAALVQRFLREARITAQLDHPGIVAVHDLGVEADGTRFYTMRLVKGATLEQRLKGCATLHERLSLLGHFVDLCQAMGFAHSKGVVHRDLKPANVMVGEHGETQLLDWGLAKQKDEVHERDEDISRISRASGTAKDSGATVMGTVLGTPAYMSPEQASGDVRAIDARSDVWSLGVVLFELLAGKRPFDGEDPWAVVALVRRNEHPRLQVLEPNAPPELVAIAEKAMATRPEDRYPTAAELAADVDAWMTGGRVSAYNYSATDRVLRFVRKRRAPLTVAAVLGAVIVVGGVAWLDRIVDERDRAREAEATATANLAALYAERAVERLEAGRNAEAALFAATSLGLRENPDARGVLLAANSRWPIRIGTVHLACHDLAMRDEHVGHCATASDLVRFDLRDGSTTVALDRDATRVAELGDGRTVAFGNAGAAWYLAPDGTITGEDFVATASIARAATAAEWARINGPRLIVRRGGVDTEYPTVGSATDLAFHPRWGWVAAMVREGVWWLPPGASVPGVLPGTDVYPVRMVAFEPGDDPRLALGTAAGGLLVGRDGDYHELPAHRGAIADLAWPLPGVVASLGEDSVLAFSAPDGRLLGRLGVPASSRFDVTPSGHLVTYDPNEANVRAWALQGLAGPGDVVAYRGDGLSTANVAPDGTFATFHGSGFVRRWSAEGAIAMERAVSTTVLKQGLARADYVAVGPTMGPFLVLEPDLSVRHELTAIDGTIGLDTTPDARAIVVSVRRYLAESYGAVVAIDPVSGDARVLHRGDVPRDLDASDRIVAFVAESGATVILGLDGLELARLPGDGREVAVLDADTVLVSAENGTVTRWTWRTGALSPLFLGAEWRHGAPIDGLAVSPDGAWVATASWDRTAAVWDAKTGALRAVLRGHEHRVGDATFSEDGRWLVTSSWDGTARRWDLAELTRDPVNVVTAVRDQVGLSVEDGRIVSR